MQAIRGPASVLPLLFFFALLVFALYAFAAVAPYRALETNARLGETVPGQRLVFVGVLAPSDQPLAIRARRGPDFLTGSASSAPYGEGPARFDLETPAGPFSFDWSQARIVQPGARARLEGNDYSGFAPGDRVTVFAKARAGGSLIAEFVSSLSPTQLIANRFGAGVRVLIAGVLMLALALLMPILVSRFRGGLRVAWPSPRARRSPRKLGAGGESCPRCGESAAKGLSNCAGCGRPVSRARQVAQIAQALGELQASGSGSILILVAEGRSLRFRWTGTIQLEFQPGELSPRDSLRTRRLLAGLGLESSREPDAVWRIELGDSPPRAAGVAHAISLDVFGSAADYGVEVIRSP